MTVVEEARNGSAPPATDEPQAETDEAVGEINISRIAAETILVPIIGTTPLIVHRFSEKAKREMLDNMQGRKSPKESKDRLRDGSAGFPATGFKSSMVGGARFYGKQVTMTALKQFVFFRGEVGDDGRSLVRLVGEPEMREDVVRVGRGGTDLRYRPQFIEWGAILDVTYVTSALTRDSVLSLIDAGGMGVGVGEWRPEKNGDFGTYRVDPDRAVEIKR